MSSGITLSAATRQNLLSLQDTASLLSTTQNRLSTGKKVNSALDNPVNFFTSQSLSGRSSDLSSLIDGISNGIQTIQAANQGITNISKLTQQLKSTAQQALASSNAFTAKSSVSSATTITVDPTTKSILGGALTAATATGGTTYATASLGTGSAATPSTSTGSVAIADDTALQALSGAITVNDGAGNTATYTINNTSTKTALTTALSTSGFTASFDANDHLVITRADGTNFTATGAGATATGNAAGGTGGAPGTPGDAFSLTVGGTTVTLNAAASGSATGTYTNLSTLVNAINGSAVGSATAAAGKVTASIGTGADAGKLVLTGGDTTTSFTAGGAAATKLGFAGTVTSPATTGGLSGKTLTVSVGGAAATTITFGSGAVQTLDQLNVALEAANAQASIDTAGNLSITTTNEAGADSLQLGGTATTGLGALFTDTALKTATLGGDGKNSRDKLVKDYNNLRTQIDQMAKDASYNGVNLLNGDTLKVIFNEKSTSSLSVKGFALDADTLGISAIGATDFQDANSINKVLDQLASATGVLNSQSSTFGSNLSVVQNRQDFSKNLINILDTGSANLTNADLNEEAANSQALSTRNSLAISALSLANQAQQGILQLLR